LSLHADAIEQGEASGATVYTLSNEPSDPVSAQLADRKSREDVLLGAGVARQDDQVADILMDLARVEVMPRSHALADALVEGLRATVGRLHKRPRLEAEFAVLKAPDVPSVLLEVGFMSDAQDLADLQRPEWRAQAALGIVQALEAWVVQDALQAERVRQ
jgi:N-acetylmuramoyl-L-alanine amidase